MMRKTNKFFFFFLMVMIILPSLLFAQAEIKNVYPGEVGMAGFSLKNDGKVRLSGAGAFLYYNGETKFSGWIINSNTRQLEWYLDEDKIDDSKFKDFRDGEIFEFNEEVSLKKGDYELYFAGMQNNDIRISVGGVFDRLFGRKRDRLLRRDLENLGIKVAGVSGGFTTNKGTEVADKLKKKAIVSLTDVRDDDYLQKGFALSKDTKVRIYALGEGRRFDRDIFDYGWIVNLDTHERVWVMEARDTDHAGGAEKNRMIDEEITLPKGNYMVYYVTDDSHSPEEWNAFPPDDPQFWGISIWAVNEGDMANVKPVKDIKEIKPVIDLTKMRDDEMASVGMKLTKPMELRVLCLGEGSNYSRGEFVDYGWIIDAKSRDIVWDMSDERTEHAGGADKNRMVNEVIKLDKGDYIVYYQTDDSHSYRRWNSSPPYDQEMWGISLWVTDENDRGDVKLFEEEEYKPENVLVEILRPRNYDEYRKKFTLDKETKVRIYAIGEGDRSEMYDYGWIESDDTGRIVWEMRYRHTDHAGGASKNRMVNEVITLPAGEYTVFYQTDDSHTYRHWNSSPPRDAERYGITVTKEK